MGPHHQALRDRLAVVARTLSLPGQPDANADRPTLDLVAEVVDNVRETGDPATAWLLLAGLTAAYPETDLVRATLRRAELHDAGETAFWLLGHCEKLAMEHGRADARLVVVADRTLVDVDYTAKTGFLTGIQRVVRSTARLWAADYEVELVAWNTLGGAYRRLHDEERARLLEDDVAAFVEDHRAGKRERAEILVPWKVPILVLEVPDDRMCNRLSAMADVGVASLRVVGYDCIPVSSGELVGTDVAGRFGLYLEMIKRADRVAGISHAAATEFAGYVSALSAQGVHGPSVGACVLPNVTQLSRVVTRRDARRPVVTSIGSVTRRKNQSLLVVAAERLWREGLDFELRLLGHLGGEPMPIHQLVPELRSLGRPLRVETGVSDARLAESLAESRFLVFPSLHEGFGLPVVEALTAGVPVITSDFGSLREVAEGQGGLLVDPEDLDAVTDAMRLLLTDDATHARLVTEAAARHPRTWQEYATDLWEALSA